MLLVVINMFVGLQQAFFGADFTAVSYCHIQLSKTLNMYLTVSDFAKLDLSPVTVNKQTKTVKISHCNRKFEIRAKLNIVIYVSLDL